ncbi:filament-like plant protein 7 [Nymphaea colorata]|nr:filament-like plant protein 7 [Nymphaea colorata]
MDHKSWLWRRKSSEKTIVVTDRVNLPTKGNEEEACETDKVADLEKTVKDLNEKLFSSLSENKAKDDIVKQHAKAAKEAIAGWEKAEAEAVSFKQGLDNALEQAAEADDKIAHLDGALKECMRQLRHVREEQEQRIHDAIMKVTRDHEREKIRLEEKMAEANREAVELHAENNRLNKIIQVKEKLMEEIKERSLQAEADFTALSVRLDSAEKYNATLKYELCMLEKELEIRNEEKEYNRRAADASHKQQLESMKKITKLEAECQRLRLLVRKRLPGPAAVAQMKNEVETLGRDPDELRRKRFSQGHGSAASGLSASQETISKRFVFLTERMSAMEEENKTLRETLAKTNHELESSRAVCARTMSKLTQVEAQLGQLLKGQDNLEQAKTVCVSLASISEDSRNEDENSCAESWASALISELEQFKTGKPKESCKSFGTSELSLMDDFLEMEQLAIVSVDKPLDTSHTLSKDETIGVSTAAKTIISVSEVTGKELVPFGEKDMGTDTENPEIHSKCIQKETSPGWLLRLLRGVLLDHVTEVSIDEILEAIRVALSDSPYYLPADAIELTTASSPPYSTDPSCIKPCNSSRSPPPISPRTDSYSEDGEKLYPKDKKKQLFSSKLNKSIARIIHLIEGAAQTSHADTGNHQISSESPNAPLPYSNGATGYTMRVFQWQSSELNVVLHGFVESCNDLLQEKIGLEKFASKLCSTLDWLINHCFSLQDVSTMKDTIKKHFAYDESLSETESETGGLETPTSLPKSTESEKHITVDQARASGLSGFQENHDSFCLKQGIKLKTREEFCSFNGETERMKIEKKELEDRLQLASDLNDSLKHQIQQLDKKISSLELELAGVKDEKSSIEDQLKKHRLLNDDLEEKLSSVRVEVGESNQKLSSLEVELEEKINCLEALETTCLELQLQLESAKKRETSLGVEEAEKRLRNDLEISAASEKLAECQETILNLGKQLKALASPRDAALLDKVIPFSQRRPSLLDQMLADDETKSGSCRSPKTKDIICTTVPDKQGAADHQKSGLPPANNPQAGLLYGWKVLNSDPNHHGAESALDNAYQSTPVKSPRNYFGSVEKQRPESRTSDASLAIVPKRQGGGSSGGFIKRLLLRKRRASSKKSLGII